VASKLSLLLSSKMLGDLFNGGSILIFSFVAALLNADILFPVPDLLSGLKFMITFLLELFCAFAIFLIRGTNDLVEFAGYMPLGI